MPTNIVVLGEISGSNPCDFQMLFLICRNSSKDLLFYDVTAELIGSSAVHYILLSAIVLDGTSPVLPVSPVCADCLCSGCVLLRARG